MKELSEINKQLCDKYDNWYREFTENCKPLIEERYSNPYYISIPKGWFDSTVRIMIVGEEGHGEWGCGKKNNEIDANDFGRIQAFNWGYIAKQLYDGKTDYALYRTEYDEKWNNSAFWRRARKLAANRVCAWTNIDKIHRLGTSKCALTEREREILHSVDCRILHEEIKLLKPTHVVFFGWHGISLKHELPDIYDKLYVKSADGNYIWDKNVVSIEEGGVQYLFTYHPNWGCRQKGYEGKVLDELRF